MGGLRGREVLLLIAQMAHVFKWAKETEVFQGILLYYGSLTLKISCQNHNAGGYCLGPHQTLTFSGVLYQVVCSLTRYEKSMELKGVSELGSLIVSKVCH